MTSFRYQAIEASGAPIEGVIEAEDRKAALQLLGKRGLFPSRLEAGAGDERRRGPGVAARGGPERRPGVGRAGQAEGDYGLHAGDERAARGVDSDPAGPQRAG